MDHLTRSLWNSTEDHSSTQLLQWNHSTRIPLDISIQPDTWTGRHGPGVDHVLLQRSDDEGSGWGNICLRRPPTTSLRQHRLTAAIAQPRQHHQCIRFIILPETRTYQSPNLHFPIAILKATRNSQPAHPTPHFVAACNSAVGSRCSGQAIHTRRRSINGARW